MHTYVAYVLEPDCIENDVGSWDEEENWFEKERQAVEMSGSRAAGLRQKRVRKRWDDAKISP